MTIQRVIPIDSTAWREEVMQILMEDLNGDAPPLIDESIQTGVDVHGEPPALVETNNTYCVKTSAELESVTECRQLS